MRSASEALADSASSEVRTRLFWAVDALAAVRELSGVDISGSGAGAFYGSVIAPLIAYGETALAALFLPEQDGWRCVAQRYLDGAANGPYEPDRVFTAAEMTASSLVECLPQGRGSSLLLPVRAGDPAAAMLALGHPRAGWFDQWREHTCKLYAAVLGHVLENAHRARHLEATVNERTHQLEAALREAEQLKRRYEQLSNLDELTGLPNRRFFFPAVEAVLGRALRYGHSFSLILMDIDHFKRTNDLYGHAAGDRVLRRVAEALRAELRQGDLIARFGGEEFVIALPSTGTDGALPLARRIQERVGAITANGPEGPISTTLSIGVTSLGERGEVPGRKLLDALLREADLAMYYCKRSGRNQIRTYAELPPEATRLPDE